MLDIPIYLCYNTCIECELEKKMFGYKCFYNQKTCEVYADTSYGAQKQAQAYFRVKDNKRYMISVYRCVDSAGNQVIQSTVEV